MGKYRRQLEEQTGESVAEWNARIQSEAPDDEAGLRRWLEERDITGYTQSMLVMELFGYPDFLQMSDAELIDGQYEDREHLRPILDRILNVVRERHPEVEIAGRKGYVPLHTPRRQFAVVKASTTRRSRGSTMPGNEASDSHTHGPPTTAYSLSNPSAASAGGRCP